MNLPSAPRAAAPTELRTVALGELAFEALGGEEGRGELESRLTHAVGAYLALGPEGAPAYPAYLQELPRTAVADVAIRLERADLELVEAEARRAGVSIDQLITHAALHYAAELDAGRIPGPVPQRAEEATIGEASSSVS